MKIFCALFFLSVCFSGAYAGEKSVQEEGRQKLLSFFAGEWISRGLYVVTKLEIADRLQSGPKSAEELAALSQSNIDSLSRLLKMLSSFGIFEEVSPNVFANTDVSRLLTKSNPDTLHALSLFYGEDINKAWLEIFPSVQSGTPAFELVFKEPVFSYFKGHPDRFLLFQEAMKEKSQAVINSALSNYNFGQFNSVCDIGGGYGQFIQVLLQKYQHMSGMVFELPEVIEKIKQQNPQFASNRCQLVGGDFFASIPKGQDAYLLKSVIHDWDDEKAEQILKNCFKAMDTDSRLLLIEVILQPGEKQSYAQCMDFLMHAITGGKERNLHSITRLLENSGFIIENIYPTTTEFSVIEVKKGQHEN